jgi:hypothetical protein
MQGFPTDRRVAFHFTPPTECSTHTHSMKFHKPLLVERRSTYRPTARECAVRTTHIMAPHLLNSLPDGLCLCWVNHDNRWQWGVRATKRILIGDLAINASEYTGTRTTGPADEDREWRCADASFVMTTVLHSRFETCVGALSSPPPPLSWAALAPVPSGRCTSTPGA